MGECMSKLRTSRTNNMKNQDQVFIQKRLSTSASSDEQFENQLPSRRQMRYWNRRLNSILGNGNGNVNGISQVSQNDVGKFFNYAGLSKETIKGLYEFFKNGRQILTVQGFIEGLKKFVSLSDSELAAVIYSLYFSKGMNTQLDLSNFQRDFKPFFKGKDQPNSNNLRMTPNIKQNLANINELKVALDHRKLPSDNQKCLKWLNKNLRFRHFRSFFLDQGVRLDQMQAYKLFLLDYNFSQSRLAAKNNDVQKQVKIINWRWCQKMLRYFEQKYEIDGSHNKLRRRPTIDADSIFYQTERTRKQSIDMKRSSIGSIAGLGDPLLLQHQSSSTFGYTSTIGRKSNQVFNYFSNNNSNNKNLYSSSINNPAPVEPSMINLRQKQINSGLSFRNHPGQIDNYPLIGNFQWQLKRNIRKDVDYVTIKQQTFDKLLMAFGGGPILQRKIIKGYIQLRPYFVLKCRFINEANSYASTLTEMKLQRISPSDALGTFQLDLPKQTVCYHKNIGGQWFKFPDNISANGYYDKNQKIMDVFSQTSFLAYMLPQYEKYFKQKYMQISQVPRLGQMYQSRTYKIIDSIQQRTISSDKIQVCISNDQEKGFTQFVVLNWTHHIKRKLPLSQFKLNFVLTKNMLINTTMPKKNRSGISNLGNTCYLNAVIQALISTFKQDDLMALKGELGVELKLLAKNLREKKKSVSPFDFKTMFDKRADYFQGQQQHDAHQFCLTLIDQLQEDNKQYIEKNFQGKYKTSDRCSKCLKTQQLIQPCYIVSLPLRDFATKQVKIDYIIDNKSIQTVIFTIKQQSTVAEWKAAFQRVTGAKQYYLCEVQNYLITKTFNREDNIDSVLYKQLQIENHFLITAYQTHVFLSKQKFQRKKHDFRTYKSSRNTYHIVRVQESSTALLAKSANDLETIDDNSRKLKIKFPGNQQRIVNQSQLLAFPEQYPYRETYVKIINHDYSYNQNIGRPFVFKLPDSSSLGAVRQALQACIGKKGYILRISPQGEHGRCQICRKTNDYSSDCFISKERMAPICWIQGVLEYVAVWQDAKQYHRIIKRNKFVPSVQTVQKPQTNGQIIQNGTQSHLRQNSLNGNTNGNLNGYNGNINGTIKYPEYSPDQSNTIINGYSQYDTFQQSLKKSQQKQLISVDQCNLCKTKNITYQRKQQIVKVPQTFIIHLKRFANKNGQICKIHTKWKLQQILYIGNQKYMLQAVLCHIGTSADFGHYITVSGGMCYDDQLVTQMKYQKIKAQEIYMLFYTREG